MRDIYKSIMSTVMGAIVFILLTSGSALAGNALEFDGVDDYVEVAHSPALQFGTGPFTIEAWINNTNTSGSAWKRIATKRGNSSSWYSLCLMANKLTFELAENFPQTYAKKSAGPWIQGDGMWHHVAAVRDGDGNLFLYVDGVEYPSDSFTGNVDNTEILEIGKWGGESRGGEIYRGKMDEVRFWNVARTQEEIASTMHKALSGEEPDLRSYYNFDHSQGAVLNDLSIYNNDGALKNMSDQSWVVSEAPVESFGSPFVETLHIANNGDDTLSVGGTVKSINASDVTERGICWSKDRFPSIVDNKVQDGGTGHGDFTCNTTELVKGETYYARAYATNSTGTGYGREVVLTAEPQPGNTLEFDGVDDYVVLDENPEIGSTFTIEMWVNPKNTDNQIFVGKGSDIDGTKAVFYLGFYSQQIHVAIGDLNEWKSHYLGASFTGWHHLAVVVEDMNDSTPKSQVTVYLDGNAMPSFQLEMTLDNSLGMPWSLGAYKWNNSLAHFFEGKMDEVRFWSVNRSQTQIVESMYKTVDHNEPGLVSYYSLNHTSGTVLQDIAGTNDGTLINMADANWGPSKAVILPDIQTHITSRTGDAAVLTGVITDNNSNPATERGFCYNTAGYPIINDDKIEVGDGSGSFTHTIDSLDTTLTYYVRTYATNKIGTGYGNQKIIAPEGDLHVVSTTEISSITTSSAVCSAVIDDATAPPPYRERVLLE